MVSFEVRYAGEASTALSTALTVNALERFLAQNLKAGL
jgi:hypothetical protein